MLVRASPSVRVRRQIAALSRAKARYPCAGDREHCFAGNLTGEDGMAEPRWDDAADLARSRAVSELAVDALVRANIVASTDFERATAGVIGFRPNTRTLGLDQPADRRFPWDFS
jgi:hypothetical protein